MVKTNLGLLAGVVAHPDWISGRIDTTWLERNVDEIIRMGEDVLLPTRASIGSSSAQPAEASADTGKSGTLTLQPGSIFHLDLSPAETPASATSSAPTKHTLTLSTIAHNTFPDRLSGTMQTTWSPTPQSFSLTQSSSKAGLSSSYDLADPNDPTHVAFPIVGKIVELHPAITGEHPEETKAGYVQKGDTLAVLSVMKMESAVTALRSGVVVRRGKAAQIGAVVGEGMLLAVIADEVGKSRL